MERRNEGPAHDTHAAALTATWRTCFFDVCVHAVALAVALVIFSIPLRADAASIGVSSPKSTYRVGDTLTVDISVNTGDQRMNAVSGVVNVPTDLLEDVVISSGGTIVNVWVQNPMVNGSTASFEGIVLNPGYQGKNGHIVHLQAKVKKAGTAEFFLRSGSVLANDGQGTNILDGLGRVALTFSGTTPTPSPNPAPTDAPETQPTPTPTLVILPPAPNVTSPSHSNLTEWSADPDVQFRWAIPSGVTAVRLLMDRDQNAVPAVLFTPPIATRTVPNVDDGEWYFHIQFRNAAGWGPVASTRVRIDTLPPERLDVTSIDSEAGRASFRIESTDAGSGVDRYEIRVDEGDVLVWRDDGTHEYQTPELAPGEHTLDVTAVDRAGNGVARSTTFTVIAPPKPPVQNVTPELPMLPWSMPKWAEDLLRYIALGAVLTGTGTVVGIHGKRIIRRFRKPSASATQSQPSASTEAAQHTLFALHEDIRDAIDLLERFKKTRRLSPGENDLLKRFKKDLQKSRSLWR